MVKIIWSLIGLNTLILLVFVASYFVINAGKNVSYEEKGWTVILSIIGAVLILLAAVPLRFSQSTGTMIFSGMMALLPLLLALAVAVVK